MQIVNLTTTTASISEFNIPNISAIITYVDGGKLDVKPHNEPNKIIFRHEKLASTKHIFYIQHTHSFFSIRSYTSHTDFVHARYGIIRKSDLYYYKTSYNQSLSRDYYEITSNIISLGSNWLFFKTNYVIDTEYAWLECTISDSDNIIHCCCPLGTDSKKRFLILYNPNTGISAEIYSGEFTIDKTLKTITENNISTDLNIIINRFYESNKLTQKSIEYTPMN